jgi:hypothetical protein
MAFVCWVYLMSSINLFCHTQEPLDTAQSAYQDAQLHLGETTASSVILVTPTSPEWFRVLNTSPYPDGTRRIKALP